MATSQPIKDTKAVIDALPIIDGQILLTTDQATNNEIYVDDGVTRKLIFKGINVDSALSTTSTNAIANNAITNSIINTTVEVSAITADNIPCGTKPVKELITSLNWFITNGWLPAPANPIVNLFKYVGGIITASTAFEASMPLTNAFDKNLSTYCATGWGVTSTTITYQFNRKIILKKVRVYINVAKAQANTVKFQYSLTGGVYTVITTLSSNSNGGWYEYELPTPVEAEFLQFVCTNGNSQVVIEEFEAYGY